MNIPSFKLPLKPGRTSTEFWLTILGSLIAGLLSATSMLDVTWAAGAIVVMTVAYNHTRTKLKVIQAEAEAHALKSATDVEAAKAMASSEVSPPPAT